MIKKIADYRKKYSLHIFLIVIFLVLLLYLLSNSFRCYLLEKNIDPNFIIGFFTVIALILSVIQNLSDRRFSYNVNLVNSIEDKGINIIAKLITIRQKSEILFITVKQVKEALNSGLIYRDSNKTLSKEDLERELEMTAAYIQTYFPEEGKSWNNLQDELSKLATNCHNILINYEENLDIIISKTPFTNRYLDNIDNITVECETLYSAIDKSAEDMYKRIIIKLNSYKDKLKDSFYFNF